MSQENCRAVCSFTCVSASKTSAQKSGSAAEFMGVATDADPIDASGGAFTPLGIHGAGIMLPLGAVTCEAIYAWPSLARALNPPARPHKITFVPAPNSLAKFFSACAQCSPTPIVRITQRLPKRLLAMSLSKFMAHNIRVVDISITVSDLV